VDFDEARLVYNRRKMLEAGIDPDTGLSLDPKAGLDEGLPPFIPPPFSFVRIIPIGGLNGSDE
jgi:hypothetical protein